MNLADRSTMTAVEFLSWVETLSNGKRYELVSGKPVEMAAERNRHNLVKTACCRALEDGVRAAGLDCTVLGDGASVVVSDDDVYEPDAVVQCGERIDLDAVTAPSPTILVEVLSPSTRGMDAGGKLYGYFQLPSVHHYMIVDPDKYVIIHHCRTESGIETSLLRDGAVRLDPPGIELEVADCFVTLKQELARR